MERFCPEPIRVLVEYRLSAISTEQLYQILLVQPQRKPTLMFNDHDESISSN